MSKIVAVVTGSSGGIGTKIVDRFLGMGWEVHGIDIKRPEIHQEGLIFHMCDIRYKLPEIQNVNILVNNAGVQSDIPGNTADLDTNLLSLIRVTEQYGLQEHIQHIVNIASTSAHTGAEFSRYAASKGGVLTYTKSIANEVAKWGARCNSISPGGVLTALNESVMLNKKKWKKIMKETPLKKWASAGEIANWVVFLCIMNKSMTGQDIIIDNGEMINSHFVW